MTKRSQHSHSPEKWTELYRKTTCVFSFLLFYTPWEEGQGMRARNQRTEDLSSRDVTAATFMCRNRNALRLNKGTCSWACFIRWQSGDSSLHVTIRDRKDEGTCVEASSQRYRPHLLSAQASSVNNSGLSCSLSRIHPSLKLFCLN